MSTWPFRFIAVVVWSLTLIVVIVQPVGAQHPEFREVNLPFMKVPLGETRIGTIKVVGKFNDRFRVTLTPHDGIRVLDEQITLTTMDNYTNGATIRLLFNPYDTNKALLELLVIGESGSLTTYLECQGIGPVPLGVFLDCSILQRSPILGYPDSIDWTYYGILPTTEAVRVTNLPFSNSNLELIVDSLDNPLVIDTTQLTIEPGQSRTLTLRLDSNKEGLYFPGFRLSSNAANYPVIQPHIAAYVEEMPKLYPENYSPELTFTKLDFVQAVILNNGGGRRLTVELPEIDTPFAWESDARQFSIPGFSGVEARVIFDTTQVGTFDQEYVIRTNSKIAEEQMIKLRLMAKIVSSVESGLTISKYHIAGRTISFTNLPGTTRVCLIDMLGQRVFEHSSVGEQVIILPESLVGCYYLLLRDGERTAHEKLLLR